MSRFFKKGGAVNDSTKKMSQQKQKTDPIIFAARSPLSEEVTKGGGKNCQEPKC